MYLNSLSSISIAGVGFFITAASSSCVSYGMDFQNGGSYFQNSLANEPFTCVEQFQGKQASFVI
jgi:hypothetical protein